jgi:ABC-type Na+ efflux pump permease subunit
MIFIFAIVGGVVLGLGINLAICFSLDHLPLYFAVPAILFVLILFFIAGTIGWFLVIEADSRRSFRKAQRDMLKKEGQN